MRLFATDDKPVPPSYSLEVRPISLEDDFNAKKAAWEKQSRRLTELLEYSMLKSCPVTRLDMPH